MALIVLVAGGIATYAYIDSRSVERELVDPMAEVQSAAVVPNPSPPATLSTNKPLEPAAPQPPTNHVIGLPLQPRLAENADETSAYSYLVTYWDTPDIGGPALAYLIEYNRRTDDGSVSAFDENGVGVLSDIYAGDWRYGFLPGDLAERSPRSATSLEPGPDHRLGRRLTQVDVVPNEAVGLTEVGSRESTVLEGEPMVMWAMSFDSRRFAAEHPQLFADWLTRWTDQDELGDRAVDASVRQIIPDRIIPEPSDEAVADPAFNDSWTELADTPLGDGDDRAVIVLGLRPDGTVATVFIRDPIHGFATYYVLVTNDPDALLRITGLDTADWVDAPPR